MKKIVLLFSLAGALLLTACGPREIPAKGDFTVRVFDDTPVRFAPDIYPEAYNAPGADSIYHLVNGRKNNVARIRTQCVCQIEGDDCLQRRPLG